MRQEVHALKRGLVGHIKIAAIPTALAMVSEITTPYRAKHPHVKFTILSRNSIEILSMLENLEVDAGLTYLDNEPLGKVRSVSLYPEQYRLLTRSEEHTSELQSLMRISYAVFCLKKKNHTHVNSTHRHLYTH